LGLKQVSTCLDEVSDIHGHLIDASVVKLLNVMQCTLVVVSDEVDGNALATKSATASNSVKK
jgi:hypothetical protein